MAAREMGDIPFAHIHSLTYDDQDLYILNKDDLKTEPKEFALFVFRRGNFQDQKEYNPDVHPNPS
jgi:hypothetical protein